MKQLSGLDASFLYMETPNTYGHVNGLAIYQRPTPGFNPYEVVKQRFASMTGHLEPFRRRIVEVPFGLDHPYWINDPDFDINFHVRQIGLAEPGSRQQLSDQVARIIGRKMDRTRPLWEVYVIDGMRDGRWAMLTKFHHATIDGAAGVLMLKLMTEQTPDEPWKFEPVDWSGERVPTPVEMLQLTFGSMMSKPVKAARLNLKVVRSLAEAAGIESVATLASRSRDALVAVVGRSPEAEATANQLRKVAMPLTPAPPTPWNARIGPHRRFAMRGSSLANIRALKDAIGGTVNDVVMAICAGALRNYLIEHDALPDVPLRAMVPVSIRTGGEDDPWTNMVSSIVAELPTDEPDPLKRVERCREAMRDAKEQMNLVPASTMMDAVDTVSPVIAGSALRLVTRLADRMRLSANVVISNVPGPREPVYYAGAELDHYIPVSIITDGMGLNITVHSYLNNLDFGLVADRDLVPDLEHLIDLHIDEIEALVEATGIDWVDVPDPQDPTVRRDGVPSTTPYRRQGIAPVSQPDGEAPPAQKPAAKKSTAKKPAAKKPAAKKPAAKKSAAKKPAAKKPAAKKSTAKKSAAKGAASAAPHSSPAPVTANSSPTGATSTDVQASDRPDDADGSSVHVGANTETAAN